MTRTTIFATAPPSGTHQNFVTYCVRVIKPRKIHSKCSLFRDKYTQNVENRTVSTDFVTSLLSRSATRTTTSATAPPSGTIQNGLFNVGTRWWPRRSAPALNLTAQEATGDQITPRAWISGQGTRQIADFGRVSLAIIQ